jgi:hypothetical protein
MHVMGCTEKERTLNGFGEWLAGQAERDDAVGDLARDFCYDVEHGCGGGVQSPGDLADHARGAHSGMADDAEEALHQAGREWGGPR